MRAVDREPIAPARTVSPERARNGLEPPPRLERWVCDGRQADGRPCGNVLMELELERGHIVVRCRKCGTWNSRIVG